MTRMNCDEKKRAKTKTPGLKPTTPLSIAVGRALIRAAKTARKVARMHGTPVYYIRDGKIVAEKP
jgi:hypothetical protein